jgi:hypothetical protein
LDDEVLDKGAAFFSAADGFDFAVEFLIHGYAEIVLH